MEKLRVKNITKNHSVARAVLDSGWIMFGKVLQYKAKMVVGVLAANTSIECSECGNNVPKSLAVRIHRCNKWGIILDRDHNAALNIPQRGLNYLKLPTERREVTPAEIERSVKQESHMLPVHDR